MSVDNLKPISPRTPEKLVIDVAIRVGLLALFVYVTFILVRPLLGILIWSVILTVALYPIFIWLRARLGGHGAVAAVVLTFLSLVIVFGPTAILSSSIVVSLENFAADIKAGTFNIPGPPADLINLPYIGKDLHSAWTLVTSNSADFFKQYGHTLLVPGEWLLKAVAEIAGSILIFAVSVIVSGSLFLYGPRLTKRIHSVSMSIAGPRGYGFVNLAGATIRNVARGVIGIAILQALVIGVALIVADVPHAGLLTFVVLILAITQIGTGLAVIPLIIWFWVTKDTTTAVLFTLSMVPVGVLEHAIKPIAMSKGLDTPMLVILIGVFGGTIAYGLHGLFLGPIFLAVFYELLTFWIEAEVPRQEDDQTT